MCTLILAWQVFDDTPVVVAANRDEAVDRPSTPPGIVEEDPTVVAPLDERAGGTWIGYNEHGLFVAITNRWTDADLVGNRSRGLLVRDALRCESASEAIAAVTEATEDDSYEGFNLVVADAEDAALLVWDGRLSETSFEPGVHVVVNVGTDRSAAVPAFDRFDADTAQERRAIARRQVEAAQRASTVLERSEREGPEEWLDRAVEVLTDHDFGFCVHRNGFGTRSSSLVQLSDDGGASYRFADGAPCENDYETVGRRQ